MKQKTRKVILALVCVITMNMAIPARAAEYSAGVTRNVPDAVTCNTCGLTAKYSNYMVTSSYIDINDSTHTAVLAHVYKCSAGHLTYKNSGQYTDGHSFNQSEDLGHSGNFHKYRIKCACGYFKDVQIICENWETQGHKKP